MPAATVTKIASDSASKALDQMADQARTVERATRSAADATQTMIAASQQAAGLLQCATSYGQAALRLNLDSLDALTQVKSPQDLMSLQMSYGAGLAKLGSQGFELFLRSMDQSARLSGLPQR